MRSEPVRPARVPAVRGEIPAGTRLRNRLAGESTRFGYDLGPGPGRCVTVAVRPIRVERMVGAILAKRVVGSVRAKGMTARRPGQVRNPLGELPRRTSRYRVPARPMRVRLSASDGGRVEGLGNREHDKDRGGHTHLLVVRPKPRCPPGPPPFRRRPDLPSSGRHATTTAEPPPRIFSPLLSAQAATPGGPDARHRARENGVR
jgi:hypothetical protein